MFELFGNFDSAEEINRAAAAQFAEGDFDAIRDIADENGIDPEDAEDYIAGDVDALTDIRSAAVGKIKVEVDELKPTDVMRDWIMQLMVLIQDDREIALAVRRKNKSLEDCMAEILKFSFSRAQEIPERIAKKAGIKVRVTEGNPSMEQAKNLIRDYYRG